MTDTLAERLRHMADNPHAIKDSAAMSKAADLLDEAVGVVECLLGRFDEMTEEVGQNPATQSEAIIARTFLARLKSLSNGEG